MKIAGVIVNYRTANETVEAIAGLLRELDGLGPSHIYVVDNASGDGSVERLNASVASRGWNDVVTIVAAPRNGGYGYGINVAVELVRTLPSTPTYVYVLNSDAEPDPGSLRRMVELMDGRPAIGVVGSLIHGTDGSLQAAAFRFPTVWSELEGNARISVVSKLLARHIVSLEPPAESRPVDWVPGTSMLVRTSVFETAGLFDEDFFLYFEEVDFCRRVRAAGWEVWYAADAPIKHEGSVSTGIVDESRRMPTYWFDSRQRYFVKHHGRAYAAACDAAFALGYTVRIAKRAVLRRPDPMRPRMLRDFLAHSAAGLVNPPQPSAPGQAVGDGKRPASEMGLQADGRSAREVPLSELLAEDYQTHGRDLGHAGFWAVAAHRVGARAGSLEPGVRRTALDATYRALSTAVRRRWNIDLPRSVELGRRVRLGNGSPSRAMDLRAQAIGDDVRIGDHTTLGPGQGNGNDLPVIEDRADLKPGVRVLGNVRVGHDAVVEENAMVAEHVPPHTTVAGRPGDPHAA